ncbi:MAG TPA: ABC transporter permease [Methylomirabilota bacterium]
MTGGHPGVIEPRIVRITPLRGSLVPDLRELWEHRELLYFLVWRDIKIRYRQSLLGVGWAVLQPFMIMVVFSVLFGRVAKLPSDGIPYPVFYYSALLPWTYFASALTQSTNSLVGHQMLVKKVYFPRMILPIAGVLSGLPDLGFSFVVLLAMMLVYGMVPGVAVLLLPAFVLIATLTAMSLGLWLSSLNAMYRDIRHAIPFVVQVGMFLSPVVYPSSMVPEAWRWLYGLNPMAGAIEGFRWALLSRGAPPGPWLLVPILGLVLLLGGGVLFFRRVEGKVIDVV